MYNEKKDVGLLKEDEEPVDPAMTNWADYASNYGRVDPEFKI